MQRLVGIFREAEFSPGRVDDDASILEHTAAALTRRRWSVRLGGRELLPAPEAAGVLAMCQAPSTLDALERSAATVINTPAAIRNCHRAATVRRLAAAGVAFAPTRIVATRAAEAAVTDATLPCWVKRGDVHAMESGDVVFADGLPAVRAALARLAARGIATAAVQAHVAGTLVKFYGVIDGRFFRCYTDASEPPAAIPTLWVTAHAAASALGLEIFGGDLVVDAAGRAVLIDVNDWPSFARCRDDAAEAIAGYVHERLLPVGTRADRARQSREPAGRHAP